MITAKEFPDRQFATKDALLKAIVEHVDELKTAKKSAVKHSDGFELPYTPEIGKIIAEKDEPAEASNPGELRVKAVINTTGLLDSHGDVHIKGLWKRSLSHSSKKLHLQEHKRDFDKVIASDAMAYTKTVSWKSLGANFDGSTQALIFDSTVKQSRNPLMFEQYKNGWVENHSVGMQYVDFDICINSEEKWAETYKANWDKYYPDVVNKDDADSAGYFWAITEAKILEGSAVLMGSNWVTPTLNNKQESASALPEQPAPSTDTQKELKEFLTQIKI